MNEHHVGQAIENFIGHQEGASFDLSDGGATMSNVYCKIGGK